MQNANCSKTINTASLSFLVCAVFTTCSLAASYTVSGTSNVVGSDLLSIAIPVPSAPSGTYTFTLVASDFNEDPTDPSPQQHVVVSANRYIGDYRSFTLNQVGDTQTVSLLSSVNLFFIDSSPADNVGTSTVEISESGTFLGSYVVDGSTNVTGTDLQSKGVLVPLTPGTHTFTLTASDFKENYNNPNAQQHVMVHGGSAFGDYRTFALNGVGDSKTITVGEATDAYLFFIDTLTSDNTGSSTVDVTSTSAPVQWSAADGGNDHWYEVVLIPNYTTWLGAKTAAESKDHLGMTGYLCTITSQEEQDFVQNLLSSTPLQVVIALVGINRMEARNQAVDGLG